MNIQKQPKKNFKNQQRRGKGIRKTLFISFRNSIQTYEQHNAQVDIKFEQL